MKRIHLIALLIFGCAGSLASKEKTLLNENFSIPNKNQNEIFNILHIQFRIKFYKNDYW